MSDDWKKIDEVPFDFERRRVSVLLDNGTNTLLVVKGAPEDILRLSRSYEADGANLQRPMDDAALAGIRANSGAGTGRLPRAGHCLAPGGAGPSACRGER